MSIYATVVDFDADTHADDCARWTEVSELDEPVDGARLGAVINGRRYWLEPATVCSCRCGPIAYQGSHVLPSADDPRAGSFSACLIPGFISRPGRPPVNNGEDYPVHPYLRVIAADGDGTAIVVLDRGQAAELNAFLTDWLANADG